MLRVAAAMLGLLVGCSFRTYETREVLRLGYQKTPRVAIVRVSNDPAFMASVVAKVKGAIAMTVVSDEVAADASQPEEMCREFKKREPAIDAQVLLVVDAQIFVKDEQKCDDVGLVERLGEKFDISKLDYTTGTVTVFGCKSSVYDYSIGTGVAQVMAYDLATCHGLHNQRFSSEEAFAHGSLAASGTQEANRQRAAAGARADFLAAFGSRLGAGFLPHGLEPSSPAPDVLELAGAESSALQPGEDYVVFDSEDSSRRYRYRVETVGPSVASGRMRIYREPREGEPAPPPLDGRIGDSVQAYSHAHRWELMPFLSVGRVSRGTDRTLIGGAIVVRYFYPRALVSAEVHWAGHLSFHGARSDLGLGAGPKVPIGPVRIYAQGEVGWTFYPEEKRDGYSYRGVGGGVEFWFRKTLFVGQVKRRWTTIADADNTNRQDADVWLFLVGIAGQVRE